MNDYYGQSKEGIVKIGDILTRTDHPTRIVTKIVDYKVYYKHIDTKQGQDFKFFVFGSYFDKYCKITKKRKNIG